MPKYFKGKHDIQWKQAGAELCQGGGAMANR